MATMKSKKTGSTFVCVDALEHADDKRKSIPTAEHQSLTTGAARKPMQVSHSRSVSNADRLKAENEARTTTGARAARLARQGSTGVDGPRRQPTAALHPGRRRRDRFPRARTEPAQPHDPGRRPAGEGEPGGARGSSSLGSRSEEIQGARAAARRLQAACGVQVEPMRRGSQRARPGVHHVQSLS